MRKNTFFLFLIAGILRAQFLWADCEGEWDSLQKADVTHRRAQGSREAAEKDYEKAQGSLNAAAAELNAVGAKLGLTGKATPGSVTFGRPSDDSGKTFFKNADYRAAKQAWQNAKANNEQAKTAKDSAVAEEEKAKGELNEARRAHEECKKRARDKKLGDEGLLLGPEPLKINDKLHEKIDDILLYETISKDDTTSNAAFVLTRSGGKTFLESSLVATGKGAQFRRWVPENVSLMIPSGRLKPVKTSRFYTGKASLLKGAATLVFSAIGTQYEQGAAKASQTPGTTCASPSGTSKAIDKVGMTAGLGLLTSTASGDITGLRNTFDVTGHEAELKDARLQFTLSNPHVRKSLSMNLPVSMKDQ